MIVISLDKCPEGGNNPMTDNYHHLFYLDPLLHDVIEGKSIFEVRIHHVNTGG